MVWLPSLRAWLKSLLFMVATLPVGVGLKVLSTMLLGALHLTWSDNRGYIVIWLVVTLSIIPVILYSYLHYFLFGKEKKSHQWLFSKESLVEGFWMWGMLIICLAMTIAYLLGLYLLEYRSVRYYDYYHYYDYVVTEGESAIVSGIWFVVATYLYHWRSLISRRWLKKTPKES